MKKTAGFLAAALLTAALLSQCKSAKNQPSLATAGQVDLARYAGHWHEIFRLPNSFQNDNSRAEAHYTLQAGGTVKVVNTEFRPDGTTKKAEGSATAVPDSGNSRLKVRFKGLAALAPVPDEGNYWIIKLEPDYSAALVGTPDRKYLWLLARDRNLNPQKRAAWEAEARKQGFDTSKLIRHP